MLTCTKKYHQKTFKLLLIGDSLQDQENEEDEPQPAKDKLGDLDKIKRVHASAQFDISVLEVRIIHVLYSKIHKPCKI